MAMLMNEDQALAVDGLRKFLDNVIEPKLKAHGEGFIPKELMVEIVSSLTDYGLISAPHPERWGGMDLDWVTHLLLWEEVGYSSIDIALPILINVRCRLAHSPRTGAHTGKVRSRSIERRNVRISGYFRAGCWL